MVALLFSFLGGGMVGFSGMWPGMIGEHYNQGYAPWWGTVMLPFWALLVGGVVLLITRLMGHDGPLLRSGREDSSMETLKQRYAWGEITREQYQQMRRDIE